MADNLGRQGLTFEDIKKDNSQEENDKTPSTQIVEEKITWGTLDLSSESMRNRAKKAVLSRIESVKEQHDEMVTRCDEWEMIWKIGSVEKTKDTVANIGSVDAWNAAEDWTATIMDAMFGVDPPLQAKGRKKYLPPETKDRIESVLWDNAKQTRIEDEAEIGIREGVKLGTFAFKDVYQLDDEPKLVVKKRPKKFQIGPISVPLPVMEKYIEQEIVVEDRPAMKQVDLRKLHFRHDKLTWMVEEINSSWEQIDKLAAENNVYSNLELAKKTSYPSEGASDNQTKIDSKSKQASDRVEKLDGDVFIFEAHHVPFRFEKDDPVPDELKGKKILCLISLANKEEVIRIQPTPFREIPYHIVPLFKQAGSVLGIGIIEIIQSLILEYNTRKNMTLDANTFGLYCMIVANMRYIKKPEQLKIRQNGVIELKDLPAGTPAESVISFIRPPVEYAQMAENLLNKIQQEITRTTRLKGVMSGEKLSPNPTATEMSIIAKEAFKSVKIILRRVDRDIFQLFFERAYVMMVLNRQNSWMVEMEREVPVMNPLTGQPVVDPMTGMPQMEKKMFWEEITPEQIYSDGIEIEMLGPTHMRDEVVLRHNIMQAMDLSTSFLPNGCGPVPNEKGEPVLFNKYRAMNDVLNTLEIENVSDYWIPAPPPPPMPPQEPLPMPPQGNAPVAPQAPGVNAGMAGPTAANLLGGAVQPGGPQG